MNSGRDCYEEIETGVLVVGEVSEEIRAALEEDHAPNYQHLE